MKKKIILLTLSSILFLLGVVKIIDWFVFCSQNRELKKNSYSLFISKYETKFPNWLQPFFNTRPDLAAIISVIFFIIAGAIFVNEKQMIFTIVGVISFILAFWNLFSLM